MQPLPERYQLRSRLMVGKEVYLVYDAERRRELVLKKAFQREADTLAYLASRNIPNIPEFVDYDGKTRLLAMEYIDGRMLSCYSNPTLREVIAWGEQLFTIFATLSEANADYDDLNKNNVLIKASGELVLIDFEFAEYREDYQDEDRVHNARRPLLLFLRLLRSGVYEPGEQECWHRLVAWGDAQLSAIDSGKLLSAVTLREQLRQLLP